MPAGGTLTAMTEDPNDGNAANVSAPQPPTSAAPAKTSPWVWVALTTSIISLLLIAVGALILVGSRFFGGLLGEYGMSYGPMDDPGMPSRAVISAIEEPCEAMVEAAEEITPYAPTAQAKRELRAWAAAAGDIADAIDGAHPKGHAKVWRDSWQDASEAVRAYADGLGTSTDRLDLPSGLGLDGMSPPPPDCMVPMAVMALDPDHSVGPWQF